LIVGELLVEVADLQFWHMDLDLSMSNNCSNLVTWMCGPPKTIVYANGRVA
jgi:hypothetical protein